MTGDPDEDRDRLVSLGARVLAKEPSGLELADPDGNEFTIRKDAVK